MRHLELALLVLVIACGSGSSTAVQPVDPGPPTDSRFAHLVDPFVGSANEGHTFPGAIRPWGMASPSPHTTLSDPLSFSSGRALSTSGYLDGAERIHGFGQTHLSGVGCPDLGAPVVVPRVGEVVPVAMEYGESFGEEVARPGYYRVHLEQSDVWVELTATERVGLHRFSFPRSGDAVVQIDAGRSLSWIRGEGEVRVVSLREVEGRVRTGAFCAEANVQDVFFVARFDRDAAEAGTWRGRTVDDSRSAEGTAGAWLRFETRPNDPVEVAVAISYVDVDGARANLEAEGLPFDQARAAAFGAWEEALGAIAIEAEEDFARIFYTALYHSLIHPNVVSDVDGRFRGLDGLVHEGDEPRWGVFSLWDTYRTVHPLLIFAYPDVQASMARTLVAMTVEAGAPPRWELGGNDTGVMVGEPASIVLADSMVKGVDDFDASSYFDIALGEAENAESSHRPGNQAYLELGYVPMDLADEVWGPVSTTLEYALADWALARMADSLGRNVERDRLDAQASRWRELFDVETGTLRPRYADGTFMDPYDPDAFEGEAGRNLSGGPGFVEGTAWQYAFFVPHDVEGLAVLHEGRFVERLQWVMDTDRFAMWNEPDIHYPWLFTRFAGEADRAGSAVHAAARRFFARTPAGLPGNDDAGAMSAWLVWAALGLYPDTPAINELALVAPMVERAEIAARGLVIDATGSGSSVSSATLDGMAVGARVAHDALEGAVLSVDRR